MSDIGPDWQTLLEWHTAGHTAEWRVQTADIPGSAHSHVRIQMRAFRVWGDDGPTQVSDPEWQTVSSHEADHPVGRVTA